MSDSDYDIQRRTGTCDASGRELQPGETFFGVLLDPPLEEMLEASKGAEKKNALGFIRRDISKEAWESGYRPKYLFSYWRGEIPEPDRKKKIFVDNSVLIQLLLDLEEAQTHVRIAFRYMLALILMRKKMLRFEGVDRIKPEDDDHMEDWWVFTPKLDPAKGPLGKWAEDRKIRVRDPHIKQEELPDMAQQLSQVLDGDFTDMETGSAE